MREGGVQRTKTVRNRRCGATKRWVNLVEKRTALLLIMNHKWKEKKQHKEGNKLYITLRLSLNSLLGLTNKKSKDVTRRRRDTRTMWRCVEGLTPPSDNTRFQGRSKTEEQSNSERKKKERKQMNRWYSLKKSLSVRCDKASTAVWCVSLWCVTYSIQKVAEACTVRNLLVFPNPDVKNIPVSKELQVKDPVDLCPNCEL